MRMPKNRRQHLVSRLLTEHAVTSQPQLVELLTAAGVPATQATVSRDLEDLGALKVRLPGGDTAYAIPEVAKDRLAPDEHLKRVLGDWAVEIGHSANLVVVRTPPGSAHVVGSALDRSGMDGIAGTIAGDDTVLVVAVESVGGKKLAARLSALAGL